MKVLRTILVTVLTIVAMAAAATGAGYAVRHYGGDARPSAVRAAEPGPSPTTPVEAGTPEPTKPTKAPRPKPVLRPGDEGERVRELQHRLHQLAWWGELTTGTYDGATREAVAGFQQKRGFRGTGVVDARTWKRLVSMSETPTRDQLFNILRPGPTLFGPGMEGEGVREVQARLIQISWLFGDVAGTYDGATTQAVRGFQAKREIPVTGEVDQRTLDRLVAMTYTPSHDEMHNIEPEPEAAGALDPRCRTGRALCVDKSTNALRWVVDGDVQMTLDVRFGSDELPTREGAFSVFTKSRDHVSSLYDTPMPMAMFFSGGQAVHYSPDFAANGYSGASHGCVNVRDYDGIAALFDQVQIGDKVIVYWS
jgi:peptidoglycan hydrolase-like protein with peptidoglycan-binding domain